MVQNENTNLEKNLNAFIGKNVTVIQDGFLQCNYLITKFKSQLY